MHKSVNLTMTTVNGVKSIPISQFPKEAWTSLFGNSSSDDNRYELYKRVPWLYRAVTLICEAIVQLPRNQDELDEMDIRVRWTDFLNSIVGDYLFHAAMYVVIEDNRLGNNKEMRRFHPSTITPQHDNMEGLIGFERKFKNGQAVKYGRDELGYTWLPSRSDELSVGAPSIVAALNAAGLLSEIDQYGIKYFKSGAVSPTIVEIEEFDTLTESEQKRTKNIFRRMFESGVEKAFEVLPVGSNTKVHNIGSPMKELAVPELSDKKREDIATALGIPISMLFSNAATHATANEDNKSFYTKTVIPIARRIEDMLNPYFAQHEINGQLEFREQEMDLFQEDEAQRSQALNNLVNAGVPRVTAMEILGFDLTDEQWAAVQESQEQPAPVMIDDNSNMITTSTDEDMVSIRAFKAVESPLTHMDMWQRKATKAYRRHNNALVEFDSDLIPPTLAAAIKGHLAEVEDREEIPSIFQHAVSLVDHHHESSDY